MSYPSRVVWPQGELSFVVFDRTRIVTRRCPRRLFRKYPMLLYPQTVIRLLYRHCALHGRAVCMGCGKSHEILGFKGFMPGAD